MSTRTRLLVAMLASFLVIPACDQNISDPGGPRQPQRAVYAAGSAVGGGSIGSLTDHEGGSVTDLLAEGAVIELEFHHDRSLFGRVFVPAGVLGFRAVDEEIDGRWAVDGAGLHFPSANGTFIEDLVLEVRDRDVVGEVSIGESRRFRITLDRVAYRDPTLSGDARISDLGFEAELDISARNRAYVHVSVENEARRARSMVLEPCAVTVRQYFPDNGEPSYVWDQRDELECSDVHRVLVLEPGATAKLSTPAFTGPRVYLGEAPAGFYRVTAIVRPVSVELEVKDGRFGHF